MSNYKGKGARGTFRDLLRHPTRKREEAGNELAFIFRDIMDEKRFELDQWEYLVERFYRSVYGEDTRAVQQAKINLARGLVKDKLTWGRFMEAMLVMGFDEYTFTVSMKNRVDEKAKEYQVKVKNPYKARRSKNPVPPLPSIGEHEGEDE